MPSCWREIDDMSGRGGYCWKCHEYKDYSRVYQIWEAIWRDETNEFQDGFCPECGEELEDTGCYKCKERENPLIEIKLDDKDYVSLLCPYCLIETLIDNTIAKLEEILSKVGIDEYLNKDEEVIDFITNNISEHLWREYGQD